MSMEREPVRRGGEPGRRRSGRGRWGLLLALLATGPGWAAPAAAQDGHVLLPADSVEYLLASAPFQLPDTLRDARFEGDRTQRVALWFDDESGLLVQWARASRGGESFNNSPRYELAAYRLQQLFLDEAEYVVPPTEIRVVPLSWYRERDRRAAATFPGTGSVAVLLQYWLYGVTDENVFDPDRFESDTAYARNWAHANLLTHFIRHSDSNEGNLLVSVDDANPRVFAVDNGVSFESEISDRGTRWRTLLVRRFPGHTVERLRTLTYDDLRADLAVLVEFRIVDGELVRVPSGDNLGSGSGVRREGDRVQFGLTDREIQGAWRRIERFLEQVDAGRYRTFVPGGASGAGR